MAFEFISSIMYLIAVVLGFMSFWNLFQAAMGEENANNLAGGILDKIKRTPRTPEEEEAEKEAKKIRALADLDRRIGRNLRKEGSADAKNTKRMISNFDTLKAEFKRAIKSDDPKQLIETHVKPHAENLFSKENSDFHRYKHEIESMFEKLKEALGGIGIEDKKLAENIKKEIDKKKTEGTSTPAEIDKIISELNKEYHDAAELYQIIAGIAGQIKETKNMLEKAKEIHSTLKPIEASFLQNIDAGYYEAAMDALGRYRANLISIDTIVEQIRTELNKISALCLDLRHKAKKIQKEVKEEIKEEVKSEEEKLNKYKKEFIDLLNAMNELNPEAKSNFIDILKGYAIKPAGMSDIDWQKQRGYNWNKLRNFATVFEVAKPFGGISKLIKWLIKDIDTNINSLKMLISENKLKNYEDFINLIKKGNL
jgi:hypothetical protein